MINLKRQIGYFALVTGLITASAPVLAEQPTNMAAQNEVTNSNDSRQIECLAQNIYREAGGESIKGKFAVASVVMNRAKSGKFPTTPCSVIHQRSSKGCQFSWVCSKSGKHFNQALLNECRTIAKTVYFQKPADVTNGALYFHAKSVKPKWSKKKRSIVIGGHIFY